MYPEKPFVSVRETETGTDRQTETDRQTDRHRDRQTETDRQTDRDGGKEER